MTKKLSEDKKLRLWLDSEISILHVMFAIILLQSVTATWQQIALVVYAVWSLLYGLVRIAHVGVADPDFLKLPRK